MAEHKGLELYDEPHGNEFFIVDYDVTPPDWYRLDGRIYALGASDHVPRDPRAVFAFAVMHDWVPEALYARIPVDLEYRIPGSKAEPSPPRELGE